MTTQALLQVRVHPSSVNSQLQMPQPPEQGASHTCPVMIFDEVTRGEAMLYVRQCTAVGAHALLLVCAHLRIAPEEEQSSSTGEPAGLQHIRCPFCSSIAGAQALLLCEFVASA